MFLPLKIHISCECGAIAALDIQDKVWNDILDINVKVHHTNYTYTIDRNVLYLHYNKNEIINLIIDQCKILRNCSSSLIFKKTQLKRKCLW